MHATPDTLRTLASACLTHLQPNTVMPGRSVSIWEITTWILPMAPEHLRRVLAQNPGLPQGVAGSKAGTRWFSLADVAALRAHFMALSRGTRYGPRRHDRAPARFVVMTGPAGGTGRSTALLHLATGAALAGYRVLVIDADPAGRLAQDLGAVGAGDDSVLSLIARNCARHLQRINQDRIDRGEPPLAVDDTLSAALENPATATPQPTAWPGLDIVAATPALQQADLQIQRWQNALRRWPVMGALAQALDDGDLRSRYDLILCDTPRGLGPLAMAALGSADVVLVPVPWLSDADQIVGTGLQALSTAISTVMAEEQAMARALGQPAPPLRWRTMWVLPTRAGSGAAPLAGFAAKLGDALLPAALPEIAHLARERAAHLYDLDYRDVGRLTYAPLRQACDDVWRGVADRLALV